MHLPQNFFYEQLLIELRRQDRIADPALIYRALPKTEPETAYKIQRWQSASNQIPQPKETRGCFQRPIHNLGLA
jgi:hypothetical protein